jgi:NodT family efflux transporter outer membrane factor (OMF) lipoprotein
MNRAANLSVPRPSTGIRVRTAATFALSVTLLAATGCMVGPKYVKPTVPTYQAPNAFKDAYKDTDPNWHPATPADAALRGDWWTIFHDDQLSLLEVTAGIQNQSLKAAAARYTQARAQIAINRADLRPTIGVGPSLTGVRDSNLRPYFTPPATNNGLVDYQLPLSISYEPDLWGRIRRNVAAAREESQASAADLQNALLSIQSDLAVDYFELRAADAQRKLLDETIKDYQEALRITTNRFEGGVTNESDVFQARTQLQAAIVQERDTAVLRAQYEHAIAVLIGQPPNSFSIAEAPLNAVPPYIPSGVPSQLLERRPDIAAAERRAHEANERIGIARAAFFPTLNLNGGLGLEAVTLRNFFSASNIAFALGPSLGQTIYDAGRRRGYLSQAYGLFDESSADYRQTVLTAFQQVEDNLAALRILSDEQEQQRQATQAAQNAQNIFNNRYVGGLDTYLQVVTAQQTSLNNERNDIDLLRRRMDASVLLIKALGGGWSTANLPPN